MNRKNEKKSLGSSSSKILALLSTNRKAIGGTLVLLAIPALLNNLLTPADVSSQESRKSEKSNSQLNSSISTGKIQSTAHCASFILKQLKELLSHNTTVS